MEGMSFRIPMILSPSFLVMLMSSALAILTMRNTPISEEKRNSTLNLCTRRQFLKGALTPS